MKARISQKRLASFNKYRAVRAYRSPLDMRFHITARARNQTPVTFR